MSGVRSTEEKIYGLIGNIVMVILSLCAFLPFWLLIAASFTEEHTAVREGYKFIPSLGSTSAYGYIFQQWAQIGRAYGVTLLVTVLGTVVSVMVIMMCSYGLTQKDVPGIRVISFLIIFTMLFNGGLVPTYLVYNNILHVKNTIFGLLLPNLLCSGFNIVLVRSYIQSNIPSALVEAAEMDGAGQFKIFFQVIMPLSKPIIATIGLLNGVNYWNDWTNGLYYITDSRLYSSQQLLNEINNNIQYLSSNASAMSGIDTSNIPSNTVRMAIAVVAILPILCLYPFFQKYFSKGITLGAVKG